MQVESRPSEIPFVWMHWSAEPYLLRRQSPRGGSPPRRVVKVLPGNPSLPLRTLLSALSRGRNGGVGGSELGMDLAVRGTEVRKLFYAGGFTGVLNRENIDPEDFLQEVFRGLLARNKGTCPWDVKKSSFGHYVHIVIRCVLSNYLRRERLRDSREVMTEDGELPQGSLRTGLATVSGSVELNDLLEGIYGTGKEQAQVCQFLSALYAGQSRREALLGVGMSEAWGKQVLSEVRAALTEH